MPWFERRAVWVALGLALVHALLALAYAGRTPYRTPGVSNGQYLRDIGNPDEIAHSEYVAHLRDGKGLPILVPAEARALHTFESHQPPAYYLLAAGWAGLGPVDVRQRSAGLWMRSLNAIIGAGTVLGVYFFALWAVGRPRTALAAAAVAALLPMLAAIDGAVSNDPMTIALCTWGLALMARWRQAWTVRRAAALGALAGIAFLTKTTGLLLLPALVAAIWAGRPFDRWRNLAAALMAAAIFIVPWMARNQAAYGDLLGMSAFYETFPADHELGQVLGGARELARWAYVLAAGTALSFIGVFGYMDIHLSYGFYIPIFVFSLVGILLASSASESRALKTPVGLFLALLLLSYAVFNLRYVQPQARYLFPAIAPLVLWIVLGLERLGKAKSVLWPAGLLLLLATANMAALVRLPAEFKARTSRALEESWRQEKG